MKKIAFISVLTLLFAGCGILIPHPAAILNSPVSNPFPELATVQLVGCYGNRSAATVEFIFTVTSHTNVISKGTFGGYGGNKFVARGKTYTPAKIDASVELVRGYPSEVVISNIRSVPDYLVQFDRVELSWYFDAGHHSGKAGQNLIFNNVPIIWR
jgi:hypothetical protein